tara:strand:- start:11 stop:460 length:450 start_codon:yes stop_codon:yes gene_type:complete
MRGHRPLNENEPKPEPIVPEKPDWISSEAKAEWDRVQPELEGLGLLTRIDRGALAGYCQAWADFKATTEWIEEHGEMYKTKDKLGNVVFKVFPQVNIKSKARRDMVVFAREFGMTPSARAGIQTEAQDDEGFGAALDARMGRRRGAASD